MPETDNSITSKLSKSDFQSDKMLLSNIRHDLINPINAIIGYSELLLDIISIDLSILRDDIQSIHISGHSILTEDLGTICGIDDCKCGRKGKYFKVHGRIKSAEIRGCSDTYT